MQELLQEVPREAGPAAPVGLQPSPPPGGEHVATSLQWLTVERSRQILSVLCVLCVLSVLSVLCVLCVLCVSYVLCVLSVLSVLCVLCSSVLHCSEALASAGGHKGHQCSICHHTYSSESR